MASQIKQNAWILAVQAFSSVANTAKNNTLENTSEGASHEQAILHDHKALTVYTWKEIASDLLMYTQHVPSIL